MSYIGLESRPVAHLLGIILLILGAFMLLPIVVFYDSDRQDLLAFVGSTLITVLAGLSLRWFGGRARLELNVRQMFLLTTMAWTCLGLFSSLPLLLSSLDLRAADAVFESVSGITTTGSTVLSGLDQMPHIITFWRAQLQWMGGIGIIAMAVAILPFLSVGGMRLFRTESSDWSQKATPRALDLVRSLLLVYLVLSLLCFLAYLAGGMSLFDAVTHMASTVSTGGYSTHDASFGYFDSNLLQWIAVTFMLAGALPFVHFIRLLRGHRGSLFSDPQVRGLLRFLLITVLVLTAWKALTSGGASVLDDLTSVAFNVVSVVTTTGYASADYTTWGGLAVAAFFFLTFVGGCSGSTSGGIKIFRFQIGWLFFVTQLRTLVHPSMVKLIKYGGDPLPEDIVYSVVGFAMIFAAAFAGLTLLLALIGLDFVTAISAAATALTNVGPGLGDTIGPAGNFQPLPDTAKWLLCAGMIMGRLEIIGVLLLFAPTFWRA